MSYERMWQMPGGVGDIKRPRPPTVMCPCPTCGLETKAVETRSNRRRRVCPKGHSHHTQEISEAELKRYEVWERIEAARALLRKKGYLQ